MIPPKKLSVLIVHHAPVTRLGLSTLLASNRAFKVIGETGEAPVARGLFPDLSPDMVVLSLTRRRGDR